MQQVGERRGREIYAFSIWVNIPVLSMKMMTEVVIDWLQRSRKSYMIHCKKGRNSLFITEDIVENKYKRLVYNTIREC